MLSLWIFKKNQSGHFCYLWSWAISYLETAFNVPEVSTPILCEEDIPSRVSNATHGKTACLLPAPAENRILPSTPTLQIGKLNEGSSIPRLISPHSFCHRGENEIPTAVIPIFLYPTYRLPANWRYPLKTVWLPDKISNRVLGVEVSSPVCSGQSLICLCFSGHTWLSTQQGPSDPLWPFSFIINTASLPFENVPCEPFNISTQ